MLESLHVRSLALIEEAEVSFSDGLNILTGETGAGKSIILGSIALALGGKADRSVIREGADAALIELAFRADNDRQKEKLRELDIPEEEDDQILIKRKIYSNRSVCTVNGETVTTHQLRELAALLIDIYGQRENLRLLKREQQMGILDEYSGEAGALALKAAEDAYEEYCGIQRELDSGKMDEAARIRELDLLTYERDEILAASPAAGEDEVLEKRYRKMASAEKISASVGEASSLVEGDEGASELIARACRVLQDASSGDEDLRDVSGMLSEIDSLLSDFSRSLSDYAENLVFDPEEFAQTEERLDLLNHLKVKYGGTLDAVQEAMEERDRRIAWLQDYDAGRKKLEKNLTAARERYRRACGLLTDIRRKAAEEFSTSMQNALMELNFLQVGFRIAVDSSEEYAGSCGCDRVSFLISMNPGEPLRPLEQIASGGELSRIMLAMKSVFAGKEDIHTFIFDEIDTGISGRTAWKVAEKMGRLSKSHQILCITHLPQIAAMEDRHFVISKESENNRTFTRIQQLSEEASSGELARLLGGDRITDAVLKNAEEMKALARSSRNAETDDASAAL